MAATTKLARSVTLLSIDASIMGCSLNLDTFMSKTKWL